MSLPTTLPSYLLIIFLEDSIKTKILSCFSNITNSFSLNLISLFFIFFSNKEISYKKTPSVIVSKVLSFGTYMKKSR